MHPPHQPEHNVHMYNIRLIWKKQSVNTRYRLCNCDIISKAMGGDRKMLFLQQNFYKTETSFLQVRLIWKRQIRKIHDLHFSATMVQEHSRSSIIAHFCSKPTKYCSAVSHEKCVDLTKHQIKCPPECSFVTLLVTVCRGVFRGVAIGSWPSPLGRQDSIISIE